MRLISIFCRPSVILPRPLPAAGLSDDGDRVSGCVAMAAAFITIDAASG
jgi:hypothetical protein